MCESCAAAVGVYVRTMALLFTFVHVNYVLTTNKIMPTSTCRA